MTVGQRSGRSDVGRGRRAARVGMLVGLTIALQLAPAMLPGAGLALSAFSTLPIYILALGAPGEGLVGLAAAAAAVATIRPGGALLLAFMTGPIGLALGWTAHAGWRLHWRILLATTAETAGLMALGGITGALPFSRLLSSAGPRAEVAAALGFSLIYSFLWAAVLDNAVAPLLRRLLPR